jgi:hypothetical protein
MHSRFELEAAVIMSATEPERPVMAYRVGTHYIWGPEFDVVRFPKNSHRKKSSRPAGEWHSPSEPMPSADDFTLEYDNPIPLEPPVAPTTSSPNPGWNDPFPDFEWEKFA